MFPDNYRNLRADCGNCFGLCCVALYFSSMDGFPIDKDAGQPCLNLQPDFRCCVHRRLKELGLKGCMTFDCFGAGQKVAQVSFAGRNWRENPESTEQMFSVFLIMRQLHELLWYLTEALTLKATASIHVDLRSMLNEIEQLTYLNPDSLMQIDLTLCRLSVNALLQKSSELVRTNVLRGEKIHSKPPKKFSERADLAAADLRNINLKGINLRGACLIAADLRGTKAIGTNFIGADFRDADIRGADLTQSFFLTQAQINTAQGDVNTKLSSALKRPPHWDT